MNTQSSTVVVVAPNWLGDAVMALPAIADLKRHFSGSRLVVAARGGVAEVFRLAPLVDQVVTLTWRGSVFRQRELRADVDQLRRAEAGLAVLLPNSFASGWLVRRADIAERWGYATDVRSRLLTRVVRRPRGSRHQGEYYQYLTRELGAESGPLSPELQVHPDALDSARALLRARGWDGKSDLIMLAPGAAYGRAKQWLPAHVVRLVTSLAAQGATCVLVGSAADAAITGRILAEMSAAGAPRPIDLAGVTTLAQLAGVATLARACVSNDSGAMHLAAALGTPVVALFGPTIESETRPLVKAGGWSRVLTSPVWCRPCMLRECPLDHRCMSGITPAVVVNALGEIPSAQMQSRTGR